MGTDDLFKPDWEHCDSEKVENISRKVKTVMGDVDDDDEDLLN